MGGSIFYEYGAECSSRGLWILWLCFAPLEIAFAARVAWEKTVWTWERGPQAVGFSLMHIHPIVGMLCSFSIMLLLIPSAVYAMRRRRHLSILDGLMLMCSVFITAAITPPDAFFTGKSK
jgi:hypothetical protein